MFVMVRMRVHEHMELPEDFEVDCSPWDTVRSPLTVSSVLVMGLAVAYMSW